MNIDMAIFNEVYLPLLNNTERYTVLMGGGGSGKSVFAVQKMILKSLKEKRRVLIIRKVQKDIKDSIFDLFVEQLENFQILSQCKVTPSNLTINFPNGSELLFKGLEEPERIKSINNIDDIVIEEGTELTLDDFLQLSIRLRSKKANPQIHIMFNPISKSNWVYKYFFKSERPNTVILKTTYKDNKFLSQDYIDVLEEYKTSNPLYYQIYALGEFGNLDKTVFTNNWRVEPVEDKGDLLCSIDWGYSNDPTAIIGCYLEGSNLYVVGEAAYKKGMFIEDIAEAIKAKGWEQYPFSCDSSEPRSIADIKRQGIKAYPVKKAKDSIMNGITYLQSLNIIIDPSCKNLIQEMEDYTWLKDKDGVYINKPNPKCADHLIDALRYAVEIMRTNQKVKIFNKAALGL